jgi:hypothetical protein
VKGTAVQAKIVSGGFSRAFYGVRGLFRSLSGDTISFSDVNKSNEIATKADIAGIPRDAIMVDAIRPIRVVEFFPSGEVPERVDYFLLHEIDDIWTVVLFSGRVYLADARGETIESFQAINVQREKTT